MAAWYDEDASRHETKWWLELLALLPVGGLLVIDLGFFGFEWFDAMSAAGKYFLTRQKQQVRYDVVKTLSYGTHYPGRNHSNGSASHSQEPASGAPSVGVMGQNKAIVT